MKLLMEFHLCITFTEKKNISAEWFGLNKQHLLYLLDILILKY